MSLLRQRTKRRQKGVIKQMQVKDVNYGKTVRKSYAKYQEILQMPNLLKIQKDSYDWFRAVLPGLLPRREAQVHH